MGRVAVAATEDLRAIAIAAGAADPSEIVYYNETGELEVPDVNDAALSAAVASILDGSASVTTAMVANRIEELSAHARALIESGFLSDANGLHATPKWYDSEIEDQLNLVGNVSSMMDADSTIHACRDVQCGTKTYTSHTKAQLRRVLKDGRERKLAILVEFNTLKAQCLAAATKGALDAIQWTMT